MHSYYVLPKLACGCDALLEREFSKRYKSVINVSAGTRTFWALRARSAYQICEQYVDTREEKLTDFCKIIVTVHPSRLSSVCGLGLRHLPICFFCLPERS